MKKQSPDSDVEIIYAGFSCNVNQGCSTKICPINTSNIIDCANCCNNLDSNAASYVNFQEGDCRLSSDPFFYKDIEGKCICYNNSVYTPVDNTTITYPSIEKYQLFRVINKQNNVIDVDNPETLTNALIESLDDI